MLESPGELASGSMPSVCPGCARVSMLGCCSGDLAALGDSMPSTFCRFPLLDLRPVSVLAGLLPSGVLGSLLAGFSPLVAAERG